MSKRTSTAKQQIHRYATWKNAGRIVGIVVLLLAYSAALWFVPKWTATKFVASTTPWRLCVEATVTYPTHEAASKAVDEYFPIVFDTNGKASIEKRVYKDYRFYDDTTVVYGNHDCGRWSNSYIPRDQEVTVLITASVIRIAMIFGMFLLMIVVSITTSLRSKIQPRVSEDVSKDEDDKKEEME